MLPKSQDFNQRDFEWFMPESANESIEPESLHAVALNRPAWWGEEKYDGSLYAARFFQDNRVTYTSRRVSATGGGAVERTEQMYSTNRGPSTLAHTLLLGEVMLPEGAGDHGALNSILLSNPAKSRMRQEAIGNLRYIAFDCCWFKGLDIRLQPLQMRRDMAERAVQEWNDFRWRAKGPDVWRGRRASLISMSPRFSAADAPAMFREIVARGGEGVMLKNPQSPYGYGLTKCKKAFDVSVFVVGYEPGKGKYTGGVGAIKFGVVGTAGQILDLGQCSGFEDIMRQQITRNQEAWIGRVFDVRCQPPDEPAKWPAVNQKLRHPRFIKWRDDLVAQQCTAAKAKQDFLSLTYTAPWPPRGAE